MVFIFGAGKWGYALSYALARKRINTLLYDTNIEVFNKISKNEYINTTTDIASIKDADFVIIATPTQTIKHILAYCKNKDIVIASKGVDISTHKDVVNLSLDLGIDKNNIFVLSGPSFAEDVLSDLPVALTLGYFNKQRAIELQNTISFELFRVYISKDIKGVALGGALKNVIAIASGILEGIGLGESAKAALITRGLREIIKAGVYMGGTERTFYGLSGLGDLVLTANSNKSRNKRFGLLIGRKKIEDALKEISETVEGYYTSKAIYDIAIERNLDLPIMNAVYKVLYENMSTQDAIKFLLSRELRSEDEE